MSTSAADGPAGADVARGPSAPASIQLGEGGMYRSQLAEFRYGQVLQEPQHVRLGGVGRGAGEGGAFGEQHPDWQADDE